MSSFANVREAGHFVELSEIRAEVGGEALDDAAPRTIPWAVFLDRPTESGIGAVVFPVLRVPNWDRPPRWIPSRLDCRHSRPNVRIPADSGHRFRSKADSDSG